MSEIDTFSFPPIGRDGLAEWSKAQASGASPKGRGFLPCAGNPLWEIQTRGTWQSRCVLRGCVGVGVMRHAYHLAQFLPHRAISSSSSLDHLLKNGETVLAGSVCLNGMKVDNIVQTFHYVPVDFKHYASNSFAFVNDQAEQFRRGWRQLQAGKNDVYLLPESSSSIRKWRHSSFLHSVSSYQAEGRFTYKDDPAVKSGRDSCRWQNHAGRELPQQEGRRPKDRSGIKGG